MRSVAALLERQFDECRAPKFTAEVLTAIPCKNDPLGRSDLAILSPHRVIFTFRRSHMNAVRASDAEIHLAGWSRKIFWSKPFRKMFATRPRREYDLARSVEYP